MNLNFAIEFEIKYSKKFAAIRIVDIAKDVMGSDFL